MGWKRKDFHDFYAPEPTQEIIVTLYDDRTMSYQMSTYHGIPVNPITGRRMLLTIADVLRREIEALRQGHPALQVSTPPDGAPKSFGEALPEQPVEITLTKESV